MATEINIGRNANIIAIAKKVARDLRKRQTPAETIFWNAVRNRKFQRLKFYRQHPLFITHNDKECFFVADFYCHQRRLVIEIDGKSHDDQKEYDKLRTGLINEYGVAVLRIRNEELERDVRTALGKIAPFIVHPEIA